MSYYIVVEGSSCESKVYPKWLSHLNPDLECVNDLDEVTGNRYYLVSGRGYPQYVSVIRNALADMVNHRHIDYLVIAIDAESMSHAEKTTEIQDILSGSAVEPKTRVIVQTPCLEAWALGNKVIVKRNPQDSRLQEYIQRFDVIHDDPEELPDLPERQMNRAQFAYDYLRRALRERYPRGSYSKRNPTVISHEKYFKRIVERYEQDNHIRSFFDFLTAFSGG